MSEDLREVEAYIGGLLARFTPAERAKIARKIAVDIRRSQADRIAAQQNPDGSAFEPRKAQPQPLRAKNGRIKRRARAKAMFVKLRRAKYLTATSSASEASVGFKGGAPARVAKVHQHGLRDRVSNRAGAPEIQYPRRRLLGLTEAERGQVMDTLLTIFAD